MEGEKFIRSLPLLRKRNFTRYFEDGNPCAIDLIEQLLVLEPEQRINSTQAINHPYFKDYPKKNYDDLPQFDNAFEDEEYDFGKWKGE
jgi:serine/threonine protein kinase